MKVGIKKLDGVIGDMELVIQDLDVNEYGDILDEAAAQFVHYYGASRNPNYPGRETIRSVANRLNQIDN